MYFIYRVNGAQRAQQIYFVLMEYLTASALLPKANKGAASDVCLCQINGVSGIGIDKRNFIYFVVSDIFHKEVESV